MHHYTYILFLLCSLNDSKRRNALISILDRLMKLITWLIGFVGFVTKKGMLQKEVAEYLGIERATYWDYEGVRGDRNGCFRF